MPASLRTMVVVPALLTDEDELTELVRRLEVHYLGNDDADLRFALLTDFADAPTERTDHDQALLGLARSLFARLNERHGPTGDGGRRFWLLHRARRWNEAQGAWMGWERKRGKLHELNRLLRGATDTSFLFADPTEPAELGGLGVRFVVTLDADTRMPRDTVRKLVGALAHPLARPIHDPETGRVVDGYGILQPRITPTLPRTGTGTPLQQIYAGPAGLDPYAFAVSDVYQDLFGEGSYTGKGIYDVDAFERALQGRVPENALLSHDLLEGIFARAGLVTDVELFDGYPDHYAVTSGRDHRWVRGDWQLLPWLFGRYPIPAIGRWKMLDNLRRSLVPVASLALLVLCWLLPPPAPAIWSVAVVVALALPTLAPLVAGVRVRRLRRAHVVQAGRDLGTALARISLAVVLLVDQAWRMLDAITRTGAHLASRRHLLDWVTAAQAQRGRRLELATFYRRMAPSVAVPAVAVVGVALLAPRNAPVAAAFALAWSAAPLIARWLSQPPVHEPAPTLDADGEAELRRIARQTWRFFEAVVAPEDHALPPDNLQEDPDAVVAHRTSPTNVGLYMLSTLAAHDMGWVGTAELVSRLDATMRTIEGLERHRGHLYNWYDTRGLVPLRPRYVSTVDSGNLAGHLLVLEQALRELAGQPPALDRLVAGVGDALDGTLRALHATSGDRGGGAVRKRHVEEVVEEIRALLAHPDARTASWWTSLTDLGAALADVAAGLAAERGEGYAATAEWARTARETIAVHRRDATEPVPAPHIVELADRCRAFAVSMDWSFLYDEAQRLFSIGYDCESSRLDASRYDLLASEARLASFVAIALGAVPNAHWFHLGRRLTEVGGEAALVSWSGSMFEYLMPELVMDPPAGSLVDRTDRLVVARQIRYGRDRGVPWGISEAAYHARDLHHTYQYSNFGVSGLGLKRGLADDLVIAPYATGLAAMVDPVAAAENFVRLRLVGAEGRYGFYESIDYTAARLPEGADAVVIKAYMAHHQGMMLVSLVNVLRDFPMRRRFHAIPEVVATELLLHERNPRRPSVARAHTEEAAMHLHVREIVPPVLRTFRSPHAPVPDTHRLANGRYAVAFTAAGGGQSLWRGLAVTRWRPDPTTDAHGYWIYLRDVDTGDVWSAGYQPTGIEADHYEASFNEHRVGITRRDGTLTTQLDVVVLSEDDGEMRQVTVVNHGAHTRTIEVTSYLEVVLAAHAADSAHPAFAKLFVETSFDPELEALLATRRPRSEAEPRVWAAHLALVDAPSQALQFETDRARFLGRGRTARTATAIFDGRPLSNTTGPVLDPVFAMRRQIRVPPGRSVRVVFLTLVGPERGRLAATCDKYRDPGAFDRALSESWTHAQIQLRHLGIDADEATLYQRLGTRLTYPEPALRPRRDGQPHNRRGQQSLWPFGISGDRPILLGRLSLTGDRELVRQLVHAQCWLAMKGFDFDLVLLDHRTASYAQEPLEALIRTTRFSGVVTAGQVYSLAVDAMSPQDLDLLASVARLVIDDRDGPLADQIVRRLRAEPQPAAPRAIEPRQPMRERRPPVLHLEGDNGVGGFDRDGREYAIVLGARQWTPAPWSNVIANEGFGTVVTECGGGYTFAVNSRQRQLTPWSNDPVSDEPGEVIYVRDEATGEVWTATPLPVREETPYVVRHGQGYTRFVHTSHQLELELVVLVAPDDPVKLSRLTVRNRGGQRRQLRIAAYVAWVLGEAQHTASPHVVTERDPQTGAVFATNAWAEGFAERVAFLDLGGRQDAASGDRTAFVGRNGTLARPAGLAVGASLDGRLGAGLDPCAVLGASLRLDPGAEAELVVTLGDGRDVAHARELVARYRDTPFQDVLDAAVARWDALLGAVQVRTPDRLLDHVVNRWLLYQTVSCRVWGRSAFYQSGGAYGFRDQLQDVSALLFTRPDLARAHIVRASGHQFVEGDAMHWWHPPGDRGVRTRFSDDRVWLPFVVGHYLDSTGDQSVLDERAPFLRGPELAPGQEDVYDHFPEAGEDGTVYEHAARALDVSLAVGPHGLPLIGAGDWNDGMNRVGIHGKGESVWLAWFLIQTLTRWAPLARRRGDEARASRWEAHAAALRDAVETEGWDGAWYRRAFMDDGSPIGSAGNLECRIDALAQSWAVLSGAGRVDRAFVAMGAVDEHLVRRGDGVVLLLTPPFDKTPLDPGYIKGYLPGVREKGGQYTHAALWTVMAFAELGDGNKAGELLTLLNPAHKARERSGMLRYKVEPYVVAADVYGSEQHVGRGGWTWYTGSAAWMYRVALESVLGVRLRGGNELVLRPCIPRHWPGFEVTLRLGAATVAIHVDNAAGVTHEVASVKVDGRTVDAEAPVRLPEAGEHRIDVVMGKPDTLETEF
ncbi:MAG: glucoamylase family protein [Myxococcota bacterium]